MERHLLSFAVRSSEPTTAEKKQKSAQQARYVKELWLFLTAVIALLTIINWSRRLWRFSRRRYFRSAHDDRKQSEKESPEAPQPGRTGKIAIRRLPSAIASAFRILAFRVSIPIGPSSVASITEATFIITYIVALLVWLFVNTFDLDTFFFEDRAAHLASCQLPLIVALAGKNSIISFLVGIGHEKLNVLHRAAARSCLLLLWIHAMLRVAGGLPEKFDLSHGWMRWGVTGLSAFTLATILSIRPIRNKVFEFFLVTHIFLIGVFLVGGFIHAKEPGFGSYIWPALVVWGLDRALRLLRLFWNNKVWSGKRSEYSHASIELLTSDTVRLTLRRRMHWAAGQHAYVVLPSVSKLPTEAHPFTIASIPHALDGSEGSEDKEVVFLIRGRAGFTRRLRDHASTKGAASSVPAFIDGPYGCPPNLKVYSTCILIAGGSGISYTLPLLQDLVHHARKGTSSVKKILFVWSIRESEHISWITKMLIPALMTAPSSLEIEPRIHVTGTKAKIPDLKTLEYDNSSEPASSSASEEGKKLSEFAFSVLKTRKGRPDIHRLLSDTVSTATGPVSVDVAGPSALASSVRSALSSEITSPLSVLKGSQPVTLHIETFGMVKG